MQQWKMVVLTKQNGFWTCFCHVKTTVFIHVEHGFHMCSSSFEEIFLNVAFSQERKNSFFQHGYGWAASPSMVSLVRWLALATHWFHHPSARGFPCHNNSDVLRILLLGVSFRVYISYKIRTRQKSEKYWKSGNGRNAWSPQRVHFSDWFFQKIVLDRANPQIHQSHKTLRLRREMSLPLTFIRPFRDNPQSCPLVYQRVWFLVFLGDIHP